MIASTWRRVQDRRSLQPKLLLVFLSVEQVNGGSKAEQADLHPGDVILEINGENTADMLNAEAQNKIKNTKTQLQLVVERYDGSAPILPRWPLVSLFLFYSSSLWRISTWMFDCLALSVVWRPFSLTFVCSWAVFNFYHAGPILTKQAIVIRGNASLRCMRTTQFPFPSPSH